jgi:glycosyltransferase involved in cell wall biosynthesis
MIPDFEVIDWGGYDALIPKCQQNPPSPKTTFISQTEFRIRTVSGIRMTERENRVEQMGKLSVIIPAFNESNRIYSNLEEAIATFREFGLPFEIIVVDDGSTDGTEVEIARAAQIYKEIVLVTYRDNGGKGKALREGWKKTDGDLVAFIDADLELHPRQLERFLVEMLRTDADIVIGSKRHPESIVNYPFKRRILSLGYNLMIRAVFQVKMSDTQPGLKLFKRQVLEREFPRVVVKRYAFDLELLLNALHDGFTISEVPIKVLFIRENGGRIRVNDVYHIFMDTLGIFYRDKLIHYYDRALQAPKS